MRRYNESEVAEIFKQATEAQSQQRQRALPTGQGLTLPELQDIARDVGISTEGVARAAAMIEHAGASTSQKFLGLPIGVGRAVHLDRKLSDDEWERLVVDLRETFGARGTVRQDGSLRQWTNGNLQVLLEPTAEGDRIRMRTTKGDARGMMTGGLIMAGLAGGGLVLGFLNASGDVHMLWSFGVLATMGVATFGAVALRLPAWARIRAKQMDAIAGRTAITPQTKLPSLDEE
ncbi:MAG: hypothetical protein ABIS03_06755 [Gemmatimonadaceae bacterium]